MTHSEYLKLLEHSYAMHQNVLECPPTSRLEFLSQSIFNFTTYDSEKDVFFAQKAVAVCEAINNRMTFDFIADEDNYTWFLVMVNMPFFSNRISWGTSIRGAFWDAGLNKELFELEVSLGVFENDGIPEPTFTLDTWKAFISAVIEFAKIPEKIEVSTKGAT